MTGTLKVIDKDILEIEHGVIAHQVHVQHPNGRKPGVFGKGLASVELAVTFIAEVIKLEKKQEQEMRLEWIEGFGNGHTYAEPFDGFVYAEIWLNSDGLFSAKIYGGRQRTYSVFESEKEAQDWVKTRLEEASKTVDKKQPLVTPEQVWEFYYHKDTEDEMDAARREINRNAEWISEGDYHTIDQRVYELIELAMKFGAKAALNNCLGYYNKGDESNG